MAIVIDINLNTFVDGVNFGQPADAIANNTALAPGINIALRTLLDTTVSDKDTVISTKDAEKTKIAADLAVAQTALTDVKSIAASAKPDDIAKLVADVIAKADEGTKSALQKEADALRAQIAAEQERLAKLEAELGK